jgi:hypothetical protein
MQIGCAPALLRPESRLQIIWVGPDVCALVASNVGPVAGIVVPGYRIVAVNVVPSVGLFAGRAIYDCGPLHVSVLRWWGSPGGCYRSLPWIAGGSRERAESCGVLVCFSLYARVVDRGQYIAQPDQGCGATHFCRYRKARRADGVSGRCFPKRSPTSHIVRVGRRRRRFSLGRCGDEREHAQPRC